MKLKHVGMIVVSVLAMSSAAVSAAEGDESVTTTVNGGVIHFKGEVVNAACAIDSESMNQTVELGQVRSSRLAKAGDLSSAVGFNIKLNDCDIPGSLYCSRAVRSWYCKRRCDLQSSISIIQY